MGGEDFDNDMLNRLVVEIKEESENVINIRGKTALQRLRSVCEWVKSTLSSTTQATMAVDRLFKMEAVAYGAAVQAAILNGEGNHKNTMVKEEIESDCNGSFSVKEEG
ncbi:hypothetical protein K1719_038052 [Acacia pycnantha]|nr:hypothetical protein K1719_038052 [Acacia pycnantha]